MSKLNQINSDNSVNEKETNLMQFKKENKKPPNNQSNKIFG